MRSVTVLLLLLFLSISITLSIPTLFRPMVSEGDAYIRADISQKLQINKTSDLLTGGIWLPGHMLILSGAYRLYDNPVSPRILTLLFSALSVIPLFFLTKNVFRHETDNNQRAIACFTIIVYLLLPLRYVLSTITLSEPIFIFFFLAGMNFALSTDVNRIAVGVMILNLAHSIRFESWFVIPILMARFIQGNYSMSRKFFICFLYIIFPLYWTVLPLAKNGQLFTYYLQKASAAKYEPLKESANLGSIFSLIESRLVDASSLALLCATVLGILIYVKKTYVRENRTDSWVPLIVPAYLILLTAIQIAFKTMEWLPHRYFYTPAILLLPFAGYGSYYCYAYVQKNRSALTVGLALAVVWFALIGVKTKIDALDYSVNGITDIRSDLIDTEVYALVALPQMNSCNQKLLYIKGENSYYLDSVFQYMLPKCHIYTFSRSNLSPGFLTSIHVNTLILIEQQNDESYNIFADNNFQRLYQSSFYSLLAKR